MSRSRLYGSIPVYSRIVATFAAMNAAAVKDLGANHPCGDNACAAGVAGIRDALYVLNGKWKLPLVFALTEGPARFKDIQRSLGEITPRALSKELKELELNEFVIRKIDPNDQLLITYELTPYSRTLENVLRELKDWGIQHRQRIMHGRRQEL